MKPRSHLETWACHFLFWDLNWSSSQLDREMKSSEPSLGLTLRSISFCAYSKRFSPLLVYVRNIDIYGCDRRYISYLFSNLQALLRPSLCSSLLIKHQSVSHCVKEQRLRYLKQQERRQQQTVSESEKLQRLKDRVESQEAKLKKIRAMRGQVDYSKVINGNLCMYHHMYIPFMNGPVDKHVISIATSLGDIVL